MTQRALRHIFVIFLVCGLLLGLLAMPRAKADPGIMAQGDPVGGDHTDDGTTQVNVGGDTAQNVSTEGSTTTQKHILRVTLNLTRILEMAGKETPLLRQNGGFVRDSGTGRVSSNGPRTASHPLGGIRQIFGGAVNLSWIVKVQILSERGLPLPGATVWIVDGLGSIVREIKTDQNGMTPTMVLAEVRIDGEGVQNLNPYTVVVDGGGATQEFPMMVESDGTVIFVMQLPMTGEPLGSIAYAAAAIAAIAGCLVTPLSFERTRYALSIPIIPLYSKLRREEIVGQSTRVRILNYIDLHPGEHFGAIKKALCLSNGNAIYHLRFLEKQGLVKSRVNGIFRRFYARDFMLPPDNGDALLVR